MVKQSLTTQQQASVATWLAGWVRLAARMVERERDSEWRSAPAIEASDIGVFVDAMDHVDNGLCLLAEDWPDWFPVEEGKRFRSAWTPLVELRDVIQHREQYLAGRPRKDRTHIPAPPVGTSRASE